MKERLLSAFPFSGTGCCEQRQGLPAWKGSWNKFSPKGKGKERNTALHEKDTATQEIPVLLKLCSLELRQLKEQTNKQTTNPTSPKKLQSLLPSCCVPRSTAAPEQTNGALGAGTAPSRRREAFLPFLSCKPH